MSDEDDTKTAQYFAELLGSSYDASVSRFFAGAGLRSEGVQFAFVMHGQLFLRVDDDMRNELEQMGSNPFSYQGAEKRVFVSKYFEAPESIRKDEEELSVWVGRAIRAAQKAPIKVSRTRKPKRPY